MEGGASAIVGVSSVFGPRIARTLGPNVVSSPINSHPFVGNVASMAFATTVIVTALSVLPEFN
jgi:hypothetical protein